MKIAFATLYNPQDIRRGSGSYYFMSKEIEKQGHDISYIGPIKWTPPIITRVLKKLAVKLGKKFRSYQDFFVAREIGRIVTTHLHSLNYDILLTNDYGIAAFTNASTPIVLYTDAIFPKYYADNIHPWLDNLFQPNVISCQQVTKKGLQKAALCCFPSHWAYDEAGRYGIPSDKMRVIPFGANLEEPPSIADYSHSFANVRAKGKIDILFVGRDWELKRGYIALEVLQSLQSMGVGATLHLVGSTPPIPTNDNVTVYGYLDKTVAAQRELLRELYRQSDLFLLPSSAEGFGIVFAEVAAYGIPSLSFQTTGISTAVKNGLSGVLIPMDAPDPVRAFAETIQSWFTNPDKYDSLARGSRQHFEETVNWQVAINRLIAETKTIIECEKVGSA